MSRTSTLVAAGIVGATLGCGIGCISTVSFNLLILGCKLVTKQPDPVQETARIIWYVGMILGAAFGAVLVIRYVRKPRNPS